MDKDLYYSKELHGKLTELTRGHLTVDGKEVLNPVPLLFHYEDERPLTLQEQIKRCLKVELSRQMVQQGVESFEDANDFEVGDDFDTGNDLSPYQTMIEEEPTDVEPIREPTTSSSEEEIPALVESEPEGVPEASE